RCPRCRDPAPPRVVRAARRRAPRPPRPAHRAAPRRGSTLPPSPRKPSPVTSVMIQPDTTIRRAMTSVAVPYSIASVLPSLVVIDGTNEVAHAVATAEAEAGIAFVTAGEGGLIRVNEREDGFFSDVGGLLERLVPLDATGREGLLALLLGARSEAV